MTNDPTPDPTGTPEHRGDPTHNPDARDLLDQLGLPTGSTSIDLPRVPGYDVLGEIARGGMGRVLAARDHTLGREVAVKVLLPGKGGGHAVARFVREARVTARLPHPNIPPVHALGTLPNGEPFLVLKRIHGRTLADLLTAGASPAAELLQVFERVCQAVGFAHGRGIVHRDLKPANVMVGDFGEVQVMDWGLAKSVVGSEETEVGGDDRFAATPRGALPDGEFTVAGAVLGTPAFMSPEQARGLGAEVGSRADVFSLGGVLCAILTGHPPYTGRSTAEVLQKAADGDASAARERLDGCGADPELVALAKRCLAARMADRPADAGEVARLVAAHQAGVEARLRAAERENAAATVRAVEERRRKRAQFALAAAVGLILVGVGAGAWWQDKQATDRQTEEARLTAEKNTAELQRQFDADRVAAAERDRATRNAQALELLTGQCEQSLRADDAAAAGARLAEIDRRLAEGGGGAVAGRVDRCRADLALVRELDRVDNFRWTSRDGQLPSTRHVLGEWAEKLAAYGVSLDESRRAASLARLKESHVAGRVLGTLDVWHVMEPAGDLLALLRDADPDEYRNEVRAAARDAHKLKQLAARPEALAQPARFAQAMGRVAAVPTARRQKILEAALRGKPANFLVLMTLGGLHPLNTPDGSAERVRWYQAAAAVRPNDAAVYLELGLALGDFGDLQGNIDTYNEALRLDPNHAVVNNNLGNVNPWSNRKFTNRRTTPS